jgi:hypothetical protein
MVATSAVRNDNENLIKIVLEKSDQRKLNPLPSKEQTGFAGLTVI